MVSFCAVVHCGSRANCDEGVTFYHFPSVIILQGQRTYDLSKNGTIRSLLGCIGKTSEWKNMAADGFEFARLEHELSQLMTSD